MFLSDRDNALMLYHRATANHNKNNMNNNNNNKNNMNNNNNNKNNMKHLHHQRIL